MWNWNTWKTSYNGVDVGKTKTILCSPELIHHHGHLSKWLTDRGDEQMLITLWGNKERAVPWIFQYLWEHNFTQSVSEL